jgi:hypothetical protein
MKITRNQLKKIIKEELSRVIQEAHSLERVAYERWVNESGHITPAASSVMATYFLDQGLEGDHDLHKKLAAEFYMDHQDVMRDMEQQRRDVMSGEELAAVGADYDEAGDQIDTDGDGIYDFADSDKDDDGVVDAAQGLRDIVHARIGEVYEEDVFEADLAIWLAKNQEFTLVEPGKSYSGWWGTDTIDDTSWYVDGPEEGPKEIFTMSNYGTTNEGTPVDEMPASWQQILRDVV